jgi:Family of unknown function (DUF6098)
VNVKRTITTLDELAELVEQTDRDLYIRFAREGEVDTRSVDYESGLTLPGVAVNPLRPPGWWSGRSTTEWVARQVGTYSHLQDADPDRLGWIVQGEVTDRGPDNEPLLTDVQVIGLVASKLITECVNNDGEAPAWQQSS